MASQPQEDRAKEYLDKFYARTRTSRSHVALKMEQFGNLQYIETQVGSKHEVRLFRDGFEQYSYWLDREERQPIIAKMLKAGMKPMVIAKLLQFSHATIYSDIRFLREFCPDLVEGVQFKRPLHLYKRPVVVSRRDIERRAGVSLH